jgi:hypothetical protein
VREQREQHDPLDTGRRQPVHGVVGVRSAESVGDGDDHVVATTLQFDPQRVGLMLRGRHDR